MKKIITLFERDWNGNKALVLNKVSPGAEWVIAGEGVATRKWDGTCCLVRDGKLYKRYEVKAGGKAPANFEPACEADKITGKIQGWVPVGDGPDDKWHRQAIAGGMPAGGTYELVGPKIQGNPEGFEAHCLVRHGDTTLFGCPRDFAGLKAYLEAVDVEGVVWHHPDGRMVKIKARDFGLKRIKNPMFAEGRA